MTSFTVATGSTVTTAKTVGNNDIGTIEAGGILSDTTDITWTGGSTAPGVVIDNAGTISATTRGIDTSGSFSTGSFKFVNEAGAKLISSGNDAFRINTNISSGTITVDNSGSSSPVRSTPRIPSSRMPADRRSISAPLFRPPRSST